MNTTSSFFRNFLAVAGATTLAAGVALHANGVSFPATEAIHWNGIAVETTTRALPLDPMTESRILAIVHLAMHDALNTIEPRFARYAPGSPAQPSGAVEAAVAAAAHAALRELLPEHTGELDAELQRRTQHIADTAAVMRGLALGREAAARIIKLRQGDGAAETRPHPAGSRPGEYRPTPPDLTPAFGSHWGDVRPFALRSARQFRPIPPPKPGSPQAIADLAEVRALGGVDSTLRTEEQSEIARYWWEMSTRSWNRIARDVGLARNLDLWEHTRLFALVNMALVDGFIGGFEAKYHYNYWRPVTAVREAGQPDWLSYLLTPPVPDYPSTHTVLGAAAATVLARCIGTDLVSFSMTSGEPYPNITRHFWSLSAAAQENGASRVLAGLHFTSAVRAGYQQGVAIGDWIAAHALPALENTDS